MKLKQKFDVFCLRYERQIKLVETTVQILILIAILYLITQKYFLHYKVVLVEQDTTGNFNVVKEIMVNGRVSDEFKQMYLDIPEHNKPKIIIETTGNNYNSDYYYNISGERNYQIS